MTTENPTARALALRNVLLLLLTCVAGYVDTISYLGLERVFTANMTGNTVLLGLALVHGDMQAAGRSSIALAGFLAGATLGALIVERGSPTRLWPPAVTAALVLELLLLCVFAFGWRGTSGAFSTAIPRAALIGVSAMAMGAQSVAVRRLDVLSIASTYLTGTLTSLIAGVIRERTRSSTARVAMRGSTARPEDSLQPAHGARLLATVWLVYLGAAVLASAAPQLGQTFALAFPIAVIGLVVVIAAIGFRKAG